MGGDALIQYRFDSVEQLARHLHQFGDASLLFVRDERDEIRAGRVLVELQLRLPLATTTARAHVIARSAAPLAGAWIQMDARLARHLQRRGNLTARRERRVGTNQMLQLSGPSELVVELVDISRGGVRIRGAGALLNVSDPYTLRLLGSKRTDGDLGDGARRARARRRGGTALHRSRQPAPAELLLQGGIGLDVGAAHRPRAQLLRLWSTRGAGSSPGSLAQLIADAAPCRAVRPATANSPPSCASVRVQESCASTFSNPQSSSAGRKSSSSRNGSAASCVSG